MTAKDIRVLRWPLVKLRTQSALWALAFALFAATLYLGFFFGAVYLKSIWVRAACGLALGPAIALLFRIAHDAGHGCHFAQAQLNRWTCRLFLLPSYHPYSVWILLHNGRHHSFTNLRDRDYIWIPLSKEEFDRRSIFGRGLERLFRTTLGVGLYYLCYIWFGMVLLRPTLIKKFKWIYLRDSCIVLSLFIAQLAVLGIGAHGAENYVVRVLLAIVIPFMIFNWLVGFASFLNHNHPAVPWFSRREEWSFYAGQVNCTVHVIVPKWMIFFLTDLGLHGAHHIDPRIPIWGLERAENRILGDARADIVADRWTLRRHRQIMRACKLYDYDAHRWVDFDGRPTGAALLPTFDLDARKGACMLWRQIAEPGKEARDVRGHQSAVAA